MSEKIKEIDFEELWEKICEIKDKAIDRAIEKFCDDHVPLYDGPYDTNIPGGGYVVPYYAKSTLRSLCIRLIVELCEAESEKVKGENDDH